MKFNFKETKAKVREWWTKNKENIVNAIKFTIMNVTMTFGFLLVYVMVWTSFGWPTADWAMWLLLLVSMGTEWLFLKWLAN